MKVCKLVQGCKIRVKVRQKAKNRDVNESARRAAGLTEPQTHRSSRSVSPRLPACLHPRLPASFSRHHPAFPQSCCPAMLLQQPRAQPRVQLQHRSRGFCACTPQRGTLERPLHAAGGSQSCCTKLRRHSQLFTRLNFGPFSLRRRRRAGLESPLAGKSEAVAAELKAP